MRSGSGRSAGPDELQHTVDGDFANIEYAWAGCIFRKIGLVWKRDGEYFGSLGNVAWTSVLYPLTRVYSEDPDNDNVYLRFGGQDPIFISNYTVKEADDFAGAEIQALLPWPLPVGGPRRRTEGG